MFCIGDHVVCVKKYGMIKAGEVGRLVHIFNCYPEYGVEWEIAGARRHNCCGNALNGHGFYMPEDSIKILDPVDLGELLSDCEVSIDSLLFGV